MCRIYIYFLGFKLVPSLFLEVGTLMALPFANFVG